MAHKKDFVVLFGVKLCTKPELNHKLIAKDYPNGLPPGEGPYDVITAADSKAMKKALKS